MDTGITPFLRLCETVPVQSLIVNGMPLHAVGRIVQVWEEVYGSPQLIGEPLHVPLRPGTLPVPQTAGAREFGVGMLIHGTHDKDQARHNDKWRELARIVWSPYDPLTVNRIMAFGSATGDTTETHTCRAKYVSGLEPTRVVHGSMSRLALRFINLDGYWYSTGETTTTITSGAGGVVHIGGDTETRRMSIALSGGSGLQILTNETTGVTLSYNNSTADSEAVLDVFAFTAVQNGMNTAKFVNHAGDMFWMMLARGDNSFTLTGGGTAVFRTRNAYL